MPLKTAFQPYILDFKFAAGTSRGVLKEKRTFFIKIWEDDASVFGLGECGPLHKLSIDDREDFEAELFKFLRKIERYPLPGSLEDIYKLVESLVTPEWPSIKFAMETALLDLKNGGRRIIFSNDFTAGEWQIPINGLIWMGNEEFMLSQISDKLASGFDCIKMKIGSIDFKTECSILESIRNKYDDDKVILRVDANGAFKVDDALDKLKILSQYNVHSIEQPIKSGNRRSMEDLCRQTPLPIALDEELIGISIKSEKLKLLRDIKPQYIILKPTLIGGMASCQEWISIAEGLDIGWWLTSALESNIGLNAICQYATEINVKGYQGLGTGQLYHNNIPSPLRIDNGHIHYANTGNWDITALSL